MYMSKYMDEEGIEVEELLLSTQNYLSRPLRAYERLQKAIERYQTAYDAATRTGVQTENKYGVKIQTSTRNTVEDCMCEIADREEECRMAKLLYDCEMITVLHSIYQADLSYNERRALIGMYNRGRYKTFEKLASDLGLKGRQQANYFYNQAVAKFGVNFIKENGFYMNFDE